MQNIEGKPEINYPTEWEYKVFTTDENAIHEKLFELIDKKYDLTHSKSSKKGKYTSLKLTLEVDSEEHRDRLFREIKDLEIVAYVL
jgi:putative lipoic acid-binding regulatory protein